MMPTEKKAGRLIVLSNRTAADPAARAGGLAVALWDALTQSRGLWIGWSGAIVPEVTRMPQTQFDSGVTFHLSDLSQADYDGYYLGYANSVLWPVLHNRLDLARFGANYFDDYERVNRLFAERLMEIAEPDDQIWVHDYHFLRVGALMRELGWTGALGFFLHVPFPALQTFRAIPEHAEIAEGLCGYDLIGVQTESDAINLTRYLVEDRGAELMSDDRVRLKDRTVSILHCPIGIDVDSFAAAATGETAREALAKLSRFAGGRATVIGVDRMDYSKGIPQRFRAMASLFDRYEELHGKIVFTQITPPSRSVVDQYAELREEIDGLCGRINGDYGDLDWIPIRYLARSYDREQIAGLYRMARVGLVTPLQDGMNLVAKEFIAAQNPADPGVLVLSQFAGAAEQMPEALIINPHDAVSVGDAVKQALDMPLDERISRWQKLFAGIRREDITWWRNRFLAALDAVPDRAAN